MPPSLPCNLVSKSGCMLYIYLFGKVRLEKDDKPLCLPPLQKALSLLAYLVLHKGKLHSRSQLAGLLWPDAPGEKARRYLSDALWRLKAVIEAPPTPRGTYIIVEKESIGFNPQSPHWLDVEEFEKRIRNHESGIKVQDSPIHNLKEAVELYRGDFMEGFYEDWVLTKREWLRELYFQALEHIIAFYKQRGDYNEALRYAQLLVNYDPLREGMHRELMRLYWLTGRPHSALKQYERLRRSLKEELGVEPMASTTALYHQILASLREREGTKAFPRSALEGRKPLPLIGREKERAELLGYVEAAIQGRGGLVFLEGEAGVGKTRLLEEVADGARWRGAKVLWGKCREFGEQKPYDPLREALREGLSPLRAEQLSRILEGIWLRGISLILPRLTEWLPELPPYPSLPPSQEHRRFLEAIARYIMALSFIAPHIIIIEDIQWADEATVKALDYIMPRIFGSRVLLVLSGRKEEIEQRYLIRRMLREADKAGLLKRLSLLPLSLPEAEELIAAALGLGEDRTLIPPGLSERIYQETKGNPLFILEMLSALYHEGFLLRGEDGNWQFTIASRMPLPSSLQEVALQRVNTLGPRAREALELAAVIGENFSFSLWTDSGGWDEKEILRIANLLRDRGFIVEEEKGYRFNHELIRRIIYESLGERKRHFHLRIARTIEERETKDVEALAWHFHQAEEWGKSCFYSLEAGKRSLARYAPETALHYLEWALEAASKSSPPASLLMEIRQTRGRAYFLLNRLQEAGEEYSRMLELAQQEGDKEKAALAMYDLSTVAMKKGDWNQCLSLAQEASSLAHSIGATKIEAMALDLIANYHSIRSELAQARRFRRLALQLSCQIGDEKGRAVRLSNFGIDLFLGNQYNRALRVLRRAVKLCRQVGLHHVAANAFSNIGHIYVNLGDYREAIKAFEEARKLYQELGLGDAPALTFVALGFIHQMWGERGKSLSFLQEAMEQGEDAENPFVIALAQKYRGIWEAWQGNVEKALTLLRESLAKAREANILEAEVSTLNSLGEIHRHFGFLPEALAFHREALSRAGEIPRPRNLSLINLAADLISSNRPSEALPILEEAISFPRNTGEKLRLAWILLEKAKAHLALGSPEKAQGAIESSLSLARAMGVQWLIAEGEFTRGKIFLAMGKPLQAEEALREALNVAEGVGIMPLKWRIEFALGKLKREQGHFREGQAHLREAIKAVEEIALSIRDEGMREKFGDWKPVKALYAYSGCRGKPFQGRRLWVRLPSSQASLGRPLREDEYVDVLWTIDIGEEDEEVRRREGKVTLRRKRILRLLEEARVQGAIPTEGHLAVVLGVTPRTIRNDIAALRRQGYQVVTRGTRI
ncbi:MAG TPA: tetratricopeptide repeat protein [Chloroflexi bacterium]|nr:tetratricopeptide repeat protein [Chloroflexota bacterium]